MDQGIRADLQNWNLNTRHSVYPGHSFFWWGVIIPLQNIQSLYTKRQMTQVCLIIIKCKYFSTILTIWTLTVDSLVSWGVRTHRLHLYKELIPRPANECSGYDIKQSDGEVPALEICEKWRTLSLALFPSPLWPGIVTPEWVLSMGQIEESLSKQMTAVKLWHWHDG